MATALLLALLGLPLLAALSLVAARHPVALLALYAAVVPFGSNIAVPGVAGPFGTFSTLLGLVVSGVLLLHVVVGRERVRHLPTPLPLWVLLVGVALATVVWSIDRDATVSGLSVLVSLVALYVAGSLLDVDVADVRRVGTAVVLSGAGVGLLALGQLLTGTMYVEPGTQTERFTLAGGGGEIGDANITAASLLLPLAIALTGASRPERAGRVRVLHGVAAALVLGAILLTGSRGGLVATVAVGAVALFHDPARRPRVRAVAVPVVVLLLVFALAPTNLQDRLQDVSSTGRTDIWRIGLAACDDHCLTGSGWDTFRSVHAEGLLTSPDRTGYRFGYEAHNLWLQALIEVGVLGFLVLLGALLVTYRDLLRLPTALRGPPLAALTGVLVANLFLSNLDFKYVWLVLLYVNLCLSAGGGSTGSESSPRPAAPNQRGVRMPQPG